MLRDRAQSLSIGLFFLTVLVFVSPRAATGVFAAIALFAAAHLLLNEPARAHVRTFGAVTASLLAFACWSLLTALWAPEPGKSAGKAIFLAIIIVAAHALVQLARQSTGPRLRRLSTAVLVGLLLGYAATAIEILTEQYLTRTVMTFLPYLQSGLSKHLVFEDGVLTRLSDVNINRRLGVFTLLFWPLLLLALGQGRNLRIVAGAAALGATAVMLARGSHQSSQVALVLSAAAFLLALLSRRWTTYLVGAAWCVCVFLIVPAATAAYRAELHNASWIFHSARHRIVIWGYTADQVARGSLVGVGADGTGAVHEQRKAEQGQIARDGAFEIDTGRHAHNAYLQVWYELGVVGALLFMAAGLALLRGISGLPAQVQPFALAHFTTVAAMMGFSFSIWQTWFQAAIGLSAVGLLVGAACWQSCSDRAARTTPAPATAVNPAE